MVNVTIYIYIAYMDPMGYVYILYIFLCKCVCILYIYIPGVPNGCRSGTP